MTDSDVIDLVPFAHALGPSPLYDEPAEVGQSNLAERFSGKTLSDCDPLEGPEKRSV